MRIVRLANFVAPRSGGLRTAMRALGEGYVAAGHEPVLIVPGPSAGDEVTEQGRVITLPGPVMPFSGGYRVLLHRPRVTALLDQLAPDRLEVSDRTTLRWTGAWARRHGVCTTDWVAAEFERLGVANVLRVPLGVDLDLFSSDRRSVSLRDRFAAPDEVLIVHCGRLSVEKKPERSIEALAELRSGGVPAVLVVAGDGPLRKRLARRAEGLPVAFTGFVHDRVALAALLATADVVLAPGPVETFGLAALEALACGTPVVVSGSSALPEVVGEAGVAVCGEDFAAGVAAVLDRPAVARRTAARRRAEEFGWPAAVRGFLAAHAVNEPVLR